MSDVYGKACFRQKVLTNGLNVSLLQWVGVKKDSQWSGNTDSPVKTKFQAQQSVKKVMLTDFWDMKGPITIDFF